MGRVGRRRLSAQIRLSILSAEAQFSVVAVESILADRPVVVAKQALFARD